MNKAEWPCYPAPFRETEDGAVTISMDDDVDVIAADPGVRRDGREVIRFRDMRRMLEARAEAMMLQQREMMQARPRRVQQPRRRRSRWTSERLDDVAAVVGGFIFTAILWVVLALMME